MKEQIQETTSSNNVKTSKSAIWSLICGIAGIIICLPAIPAIILGIIGLVNIKKSNGALKGTGLAITGLILGGLSFVILLAIGIPAFLGGYETAKVNTSSKEDYTAKIARTIQKDLNDGVIVCNTRVLRAGLIQCDLVFPIDATDIEAELGAKDVAELVARQGCKVTLWVTSYIGKQRVCKYEYDLYSRTVKKID